MKTIHCAHPPHHRNGFVATCRLCMANCGIHALLVLESTECSTSTRLGAQIHQLKQKLVHDTQSAQQALSKEHNNEEDGCIRLSS